MRWLSLSQWKKLLSLLSKKENYFILGLLSLALISLLTWSISYRLIHTLIVPAQGGNYTEGLIGSPHYINPVLSQANDVDQDISELVFSGLMKYNSSGELIPDLAEEYSIGEEGRVYDFFLRKNVEWHDGVLFSADDVIFTIETIQNQEYGSLLATNWIGIEVEKIDDWTVRFRLGDAYSPFLSNVTLGILPKHLWGNMPAAEFFLSDSNLKPIGTGPYKFKRFEKDTKGAVKNIYLEANKNYHFGRPYINDITFRFYPDEDSLINAYNGGDLDGLGYITAQKKFKLRNLERKLNLHTLKLPRYFAVFFNQSKSTVLSDKTVRLALNHATNKQEIIDEVLNGEGVVVSSPIPAGVFGHTAEMDIYDFALEHANNILEADEWIKNEETGIREKDDDILKITLVTTEWSELQQVATLLQQQWSKLGAEVEIQILSSSEIQQDYIRPREYQALLFGEVLSAGPDPFAFWHSSQKRDPGLNLAFYSNKDVDKLLSDLRETLDRESQLEKYKEFQELIVETAPVVFLYNPFYLYPVNKKIKGIEVENIAIPSSRFSEIEKWYIKTDRVKK